MKQILLLGATRYSEAFIDSFESDPGLTFAGCVENLDRSKCGTTIAGCPVLWFEDIDHLRDSHRLICVLATTRRRGWIDQMAERGFAFATLVHPGSHVSRRTGLGAGVSIDVGAIIAGYSEIGEHVRIGRGASCGHHTSVGRCATIHPGAVVSGNCRIGSGVTIGAGATVIDGISIGEDAVIAAGAVVTKDIPAAALFAGNRGSVLRQGYGPI